VIKKVWLKIKLVSNRLSTKYRTVLRNANKKKHQLYFCPRFDLYLLVCPSFFQTLHTCPYFFNLNVCTAPILSTGTNTVCMSVQRHVCPWYEWHYCLMDFCAPFQLCVVTRARARCHLSAYKNVGSHFAGKNVILFSGVHELIWRTPI
jgi:hypothetical protein